MNKKSLYQEKDIEIKALKESIKYVKKLDFFSKKRNKKLDDSKVA